MRGLLRHAFAIIVLLVATLAPAQTAHPPSVHPTKMVHPMGQMHYFDLTGFVVTIGSQSNGSTNFVVATPGSGTDCHQTPADGDAKSTGFDCPAQGRLRYIGTETLRFHVAATYSFTAATANDVFVIAVAKNGVLLPDSRALATLGTGVTHGASIHAFPYLSNGDYLEFVVANTTAGRNMTAKTLQLFAMGMP